MAYYKYGNGNYAFNTLQDIFENIPISEASSPIILNKAIISENIFVNNGSLNIQYENIKFPDENKIFQNGLKININNDLYSINDLYNYINHYTDIEVKNYPDNGTIQVGHRLYAFKNNERYDIVVPCNDFYSQKSLLKELTGIKININNTDNIIAKNGNWGIINSSNEIKVPFIYDVISPLQENTAENVSFKDNKIFLEYIKSNNSNEYYLVKKGYGWGIIDENNNTVIPFEYRKNSDNDELNQLKSQINKKIQYDNDKAERQGMKEGLPYFILDLLLLPFYIILPYPFSCYVHINYF